VGPGIASFLGLPAITYVSKIGELADGGVRVERLVEGGRERLWAALPAVLTVVKEIAYPRLPTLRGKQRARQAQVPVWGPPEIEAREDWLGLKGSPTRVVKIEKPQVARQGEIIRIKEAEDVDRAVDAVMARLREWRILS